MPYTTESGLERPHFAFVLDALEKQIIPAVNKERRRLRIKGSPFKTPWSEVRLYEPCTLFFPLYVFLWLLGVERSPRH